MEGDIERVLHLNDFRGELCGTGDLSGKEYAYWPDADNEIDFVVCLSGCPVSDTKKTICLYDTDHETPTSTCYNGIASKPFSKFCLPADEDQREPIYEALFEDVDMVIQRAAGDVLRVWDVVAISYCVAGVVALIYLVFYRFPSTLKFVLILSAFLTLLLLLAIAAFLYFEEDRVYDLLYDDDFYDMEMDGSDRDIHVKVY
jgi:hypothetical protein